MNSPVILEASPSGPSYLLYEYGDLPSDRRVRVNFLSMDNTSDICAIASIQTSLCPKVDIVDSPERRGRFQTMRSIASITAKENDTDPHFGYFYVVLSVLPDDGVGNSCLSASQGLGGELLLFGTAVNNFNPTEYSGQDRTKRVIITVKLVNPNLPAAIIVPIVIYIIFVVIAIIWIVATLFRRRRKKKEYSVSEEGGLKGDVELNEQQAEGEAQDCSESNGHSEHQLNEQLPTSQQNGEGVTNGSAGNVQTTNSCAHENFKVKHYMAELQPIDDSPEVQKEYFHYSLYLLVIIVFYSIPAYQLAVTYQRLLSSSGNEDICYYNSLCAYLLDTTTLTLSAFNNIFSNIGFVCLGALYIGVACIRRRRYRRQEEMNNNLEYDQRQGVPQTFGIYYAIGLAMIGQAFMSSAYHLCPSTTNYQFDATFMYVLAVLGMLKVLTTRAPDLAPALHRHALFLMIIIIVVVLGGVLFHFLAFRIIFMIFYIITAACYALEVYYRWQVKLDPKSIKALFNMYKQDGVCPPQHWPKFILVLVSLFLNIVIAAGIFPAEAQNYDFARYFLLIILVNFIIYLLYYLFTKCCYKECFTVKVYKPVMHLVLAFCMWVPSIYFFAQDVTDTSVSPALSRDGNQECVLFGFYDFHDLWHFMSSFALFFSFTILLTLDEGLEDKPRTNIKTF